MKAKANICGGGVTAEGTNGVAKGGDESDSESISNDTKPFGVTPKMQLESWVKVSPQAALFGRFQFRTPNGNQEAPRRDPAPTMTRNPSTDL